MSTEILITGYITSIIAYVVWYNYIMAEQAKLGQLPKSKDIILFYLELPLAPIIILLSPMLSFIGSKLIEDKTKQNKTCLPTQDFPKEECGNLHIDEFGLNRKIIFINPNEKQQEKE